MAFATDPHRLDSEWLKIAAEKLANPYISTSYRKRLEIIYLEAWKRETKSNIGLHYPMERR